MYMAMCVLTLIARVIYICSTDSACADGFYSTSGAVACIQCPAGSQCPDKAQAPTQCTAGNYASASSMTCTTCPAGSFCPNPGMSIPITCATGSYQTATGQTTCDTCPPGEWPVLKELFYFAVVISKFVF